MKTLSPDQKNEFRKIYRAYGDGVAKKGADHEEVKADFFKLVNLLYDNAEEIYGWYNENTETKKLNQAIDQLNRLGNQLTEIEEKILSAGLLLNTNFNEAESSAESAIHLASGDKEMYKTYEKDISDYYSMIKRITPTPEKPETIKEKETFIANAKSTVNVIANSLMLSSSEFKEERIKHIKSTLEQSKIPAHFTHRDGQMQFRTVRPFGNYGTPDAVFSEGMAPQFVSMWGFQKGVISKPYINDSNETTGEKVGWTGGIVSTTANLKFAASFDFSQSHGQQDGWIYVYACDEAASVARHIEFGVGYDGKVSKSEKIERSNAEAAMEYIVPYMDPSRIVGARRVTHDGRLEEYKSNPFVTQSTFGDIEYMKLTLCESIDELKILEFLEGASAECHDNHDERSREEYDKKMTALIEQLPSDRIKIILELATAAQSSLKSASINQLLSDLQHTNPKKYEKLSQLTLGAVDNSSSEGKKNDGEDLSLIKVQSHFKIEFEMDKRMSKEEMAPPSHPTTRFKRIFKEQKKPEADQPEQLNQPKHNI